MRSRVLLATIIPLAAALTGCSSDDVGTDVTRDTIEERAGDVQEAAREGMSGLRTDIERLIDDVQARNAPEVKQQLLDRCRDALERLRRASSDSADRVQGLCDRIQGADITNQSVWNEIKQEVEQIA